MTCCEESKNQNKNISLVQTVQSSTVKRERQRPTITKRGHFGAFELCESKYASWVRGCLSSFGYRICQYVGVVWLVTTTKRGRKTFPMVLPVDLTFCAKKLACQWGSGKVEGSHTCVSVSGCGIFQSSFGVSLVFFSLLEQ